MSLILNGLQPVVTCKNQVQPNTVIEASGHKREQSPVFKVPSLPSPVNILSKLRILRNELHEAKCGTHPELINQIEDIKKRQTKELEQIAIYHEISQKRIDSLFDEAMRKNLSNLQMKVEQNKEEFLRKLNEEEARANSEFEISELNHHYGPAPATNISRPKRRAQGFAPATTSNGVERFVSPNTQTKAKKPKKITSIECIRFLLTDQQIAEDLLEPSVADVTPVEAQGRVTVAVDNQRLVYDGKLVPKYIPITIKAIDSEPYSAMILSIADDIVTFRAITPGDTRMPQVSFKDLSSGLIKIIRTKL